MTIRLDPLQVTDAEEMVRVLADPGLYEFIGGRPPTLDELTDRYRHQVVGRSVDGREEWLNWIVRDGDGCAVGYVQATLHAGARAEIAWVVGRAWQGHGYATTAARAMVGLLRSRGVRRVEAYIAVGHRASELVAARVGLAATGELDSEGEQLWLATT